MDLGGVGEGGEYDRNILYGILKELIKTERGEKKKFWSNWKNTKTEDENLNEKKKRP